MRSLILAGAVALALAAGAAQALPAAAVGQQLREAGTAPSPQRAAHRHEYDSGPGFGLRFQWIFPFDEPPYRHGHPWHRRHWHDRHYPPYWGYQTWRDDGYYGRHWRHKRRGHGHDRRGHHWDDD